MSNGTHPDKPSRDAVPSDVLYRVLSRWRATLASRYRSGDLDSFVERNRAVLEGLVSQAMTRHHPSARVQAPHWFELYNPRGGVPRETLPGYRRARELAAAIFGRALSLLDEPAGEIDLASALAVLGSIDDAGEYDYDEARADADDLPFLVGTVDWSPEEVGDLLAAVMDTQSRGGIMPDDEVRGPDRRAYLGGRKAPRTAEYRQTAGVRVRSSPSLPVAVLQSARDDVRHRCLLATGRWTSWTRARCSGHRWHTDGAMGARHLPRRRHPRANQDRLDLGCDAT
jgi:hypothetical protein